MATSRRVCPNSLIVTHINTPSYYNRLTNDPDPEIQEQAFTILRNLTADEAGVNMVFGAMGDEGLASCLSAGLDSAHEMVVREVRPPSPLLFTFHTSQFAFYVSLSHLTTHLHRQPMSSATSPTAHAPNKTSYSHTRTSSEGCIAV